MWDKLSASQRSAIIATVGGLLSIVSQFVIPYLSDLGTPCTAALTALLTFAVNQVQLIWFKTPAVQPSAADQTTGVDALRNPERLD